MGRALIDAVPPDVRILAPRRSELDLAADPDFQTLLERGKVTAIVNCAAYTKVDQAENEPELARRINADAAGALAAAAAAFRIPMVQISTDYVFAGTKAAPYVEDDPTGPLNVYGLSKLAGEEAVRASGARHAILRTAWVFSASGNNFVKTMLRLCNRGSIDMVADQYGSPTHAEDLAKVIAAIAAELERDHPGGTWHVANAGETSWYAFAQRVFRRAAARGLAQPEVRPIPTSAYPTAAQRPANSRLATHRLAQEFGLSLREWEHAADEVVDQILASKEHSA